MTIKAVTFDLWDTLVQDDSDEAERARQGLRSKGDERRFQVWDALNRIKPIEYAKVALAYDTSEAGFSVVWKENHINWTVDQRLRVVLKGLNREVPGPVFDQLVEDHGRMEVDISPDPVPGVKDALADLASRYQLCVVSDSIVTPGTGLRQILEKHGLKQYFSGFAFSDEVGHSKPHPSMFESATQQLGIELNELVHIGDRDHNDVKGSHGVGGKAILFTATRADDRDNTTADAVCDSYVDLPVVVDRIAASA